MNLDSRALSPSDSEVPSGMCHVTVVDSGAMVCVCALTMCVCRLENALRNFACLTTGDVIAINYNEKVSVSATGPAGPGAQLRVDRT